MGERAVKMWCEAGDWERALAVAGKHWRGEGVKYVEEKKKERSSSREKDDS